MEKPLKLKLTAYLFLSAISFSYLVLAHRGGISVPLFVVIQFVCLYVILPKKKPLLVLLPLFILALNAFISANPMWRIPNLFVAVALYSVMALWLMGSLSIKEKAVLLFFKNMGRHMAEALSHFPVPVKWGIETQRAHMPTIKRVAIGVGISIPCLLFLLIMLSLADEIFARTIHQVFSWIFRIIEIDSLWRGLLGAVAGFYLFGVIYAVYVQPHRDETSQQGERIRRGDLMILNIVLTSVLLIYTLFVIIQFRYLFARPDNLPYGLDYVQYARRGFFELLFLTGVNILFILLAVWLSKAQVGKGAKLTKILCLYLCAVTVVLLVSSFYRMWLYSSDDGLTRLRFMVFGFLIFEAVGLLFTFFYIIRPKFNIVAVYAIIALSYYLLLNLVPMDRIIARDQIDRYFETGRGGISYTLTLSPDAAPEIARLLESENDHARNAAQAYFERASRFETENWRQWNLSIHQLLQLRQSLFT